MCSRFILQSQLTGWMHINTNRNTRKKKYIYICVCVFDKIEQTLCLFNLWSIQVFIWIIWPLDWMNLGGHHIFTYILKCLLHFSCQISLLPLVKFFTSVNSPHPTCSSFFSLYKCIWFVFVFDISLFAFPKMAPVEVESTREKYGAFLNSFYSQIRWFICVCSISWNMFKRKNISSVCVCVCIYIYVCVCVCVIYRFRIP